MKKRILFVDDERNVLEGLRRMLRNMRQEWEMVFAESGQQALDILRDEPFDVVVSDMRMPNMDGCQLLSKVKEHHPELVRIILSGYADTEMILKSVRVAHQYLAKPYDCETLKSTVARALALRELLADEMLIRLVSSIETLPSVPSLYQEVMQELSTPNASMEKVGKIIAKDVSMTAKILQLANSAFFGRSQRVNNLERALVLLGLDIIVALVLSVEIFSAPKPASVSHFSIPTLWDHSMKTAVCARTLAKEEKQPRQSIDDAFLAGLLHDIGKLILATNLSEIYGKLMTLSVKTERSIQEVERVALGITHAEVGGYLMGLWGFPDHVVEAVACHHSPHRGLAESFSPMTAVHVGNALVYTDHADGPKQVADRLALDYLADVGLDHRLAAWEAACKKELRQGEGDG